MFGVGAVGAAVKRWLSRRPKEDDGIDAAGQFAACAAMFYELADAGRAMGKDPLEIHVAEERGDGALQVAHRLLHRATGDWGAAQADIDEYIGKARRVWRTELRKEGGISPSGRVAKLVEIWAAQAPTSHGGVG